MRHVTIGILLLLTLAGRLAAQVPLVGVETTPASGVDLSLTCPFEALPVAGFVPVVVKIQNRSGRARSWDFRAQHSAQFGSGSKFTLTQTITVENESERTVELLVPLALPNNPGYSFPALKIQVSGHGIARGEAQWPGSHRSKGNPQTAFVAMSRALALRSWGPLEKQLTDRGRDLLGSAFDPALASQDWRGWAGVDVLFISDPEWSAMTAGARTAIEDWVARGGQLFICHTTKTRVMRTHGSGEIRDVSWNGTELDAVQAADLILDPRNEGRLSYQLVEGYTGAWILKNAVPAREANSALIIGFVIVFAAVVGPLNLYYFASRTRRYRLFWTTPLISIAASVVLAVVIVLQDGFGGWGERFVAVLVLPEQNKEIVVQEQLSRTGVLVGRDFTVSEDLLLAPLVLDPAQRHITRSYELAGRSHGGDWFASRSLRGQYLETVRPSRARVELVGTNPPTIISSIGVPLREIVYLDEGGSKWSAQDVPTGVATTLRKQDVNALAEPFYRSSGRSAQLINRSFRGAGHFHAVAADPKGIALETLPGIRWKKTTAVFVGPVVNARREAKP